MERLSRLLHRHELLLSIGVFGVAQMGADVLADLEYGTAAAVVRLLGLAAFVGILAQSLLQRNRPLDVPLVFTEAERREDARAQLKQFEAHTRTERTVKTLDASSPVREEELYIQLRNAARLRQTNDPALWKDTLSQLVREWDEEVDERLKRWITGHYHGMVYYVNPDVVLPAAFYLGAAVGLRRDLKIYQRNSPGNYHLAIDLAGNARRVLEPPDHEIRGIQQIPADIDLPETRGEQLILHLSIGRHPPALEAHPDHAKADSVAFYYPESLPLNENWLPYVQAFVQRAKPWVDRYRQVDICMALPHSFAMALGMAFSRSLHIRLCHWYEGEYKPAAALRWIEQKLPFD
ncbi:MAG: SAVED domain-containing protein [Fimbriimonadales bacterium]|nr:SAVED domain-containing protein [Fimbriimonadales bacterium]